MRVELNGTARELSEGATVGNVLELLDISEPARGVAVAVDAEVVPRARWSSTELQPGARVEVVQAVQGG